MDREYLQSVWNGILKLPEAMGAFVRSYQHTGADFGRLEAAYREDTGGFSFSLSDAKAYQRNIGLPMVFAAIALDDSVAANLYTERLLNPSSKLVRKIPESEMDAIIRRAAQSTLASAVDILSDNDPSREKHLKDIFAGRNSAELTQKAARKACEEGLKRESLVSYPDFGRRQQVEAYLCKRAKSIGKNPGRGALEKLIFSEARYMDRYIAIDTRIKLGAEFKKITLAHDVLRYFGFQPSLQLLVDFSTPHKDPVTFLLSQEMKRLYGLASVLSDKREEHGAFVDTLLVKYLKKPTEEVYQGVLATLAVERPKNEQISKKQKENSISRKAGLAAVDYGVVSIANEISRLERPRGRRPVQLAKEALYWADRSGVTFAEVREIIGASQRFDDVVLRIREKAPQRAPEGESVRKNDGVHSIVRDYIEAEVRPFVHEIRSFRTDDGDVVNNWLADNATMRDDRTRVLGRMQRAQFGEFGITRPILNNYKATGIFEMKFKGGLRVYYAQKDKAVILLGVGGKATQVRDAIKAQERWEICKADEEAAVVVEI